MTSGRKERAGWTKRAWRLPWTTNPNPAREPDVASGSGLLEPLGSTQSKTAPPKAARSVPSRRARRIPVGFVPRRDGRRSGPIVVDLRRRSSRRVSDPGHSERLLIRRIGGDSARRFHDHRFVPSAPTAESLRLATTSRREKRAGEPERRCAASRQPGQPGGADPGARPVRAPRRSPAFNTAVVLGLVVAFLIGSVLLWRWWSVEAMSAADNGPPDPTALWAFVVIGGPALLLVALAVARLRSGRASRRQDPETPSDDPSRGM